MSWSDDIRCLYCDGRLPLYRKITHGQFCSSAHRKAYWQDQERLAVERLHQTHDSLQAYRELVPIDISAAQHIEVVQRLSAPLMAHTPEPEDWREQADPPMGRHFPATLYSVPGRRNVLEPESLRELSFTEACVETTAARDIRALITGEFRLARYVPVPVTQANPAWTPEWTASTMYSLAPAPVLRCDAEFTLPVGPEAPKRALELAAEPVAERMAEPVVVLAEEAMAPEAVEPPLAGRIPLEFHFGPADSHATDAGLGSAKLIEFPRRAFFPLGDLRLASGLAFSRAVEIGMDGRGTKASPWAGPGERVQPVLDPVFEGQNFAQLQQVKFESGALSLRMAASSEYRVAFGPAEAMPGLFETRWAGATEVAESGDVTLPVASLEPVTDFDILTVPPPAGVLELNFREILTAQDIPVSASTSALSTIYTLPLPAKLEPMLPQSGCEVLDEKPASDNFPDAVPEMRIPGSDPMARMAGLLRFANNSASQASWKHVGDFWKQAPRDLRMLVIAIPALIALVFHPTPKLSMRVSQSNPVAGMIGAQIRNVKQSLVDRAAVALDEDFRSGLDGWISKGNATAAWAFDATGFVQPGPLALYQPSMGLSDYQVQFLGMIDQKALSWVVRAQDFDNYYVVKLVVLKPGPLPEIGVTRYAVINGKAQDRADAIVPISARPDTLYRVRLEANGDEFLLEVQGQMVDSWSEPRLRRGGVGFFSARGEQSRVRWVQVTHQYDMLGRLCAYLAPYNIPTNGSW